MREPEMGEIRVSPGFPFFMSLRNIAETTGETA